MQHNTTIFESLFSRNFSDAGNDDFLRDITAKHPYFSPAQFFLLQKTEKNTDAFEKQALKTNVLFNNAYWLNFQLKQTEPQVEEIEDTKQVPVIQPIEVKAEEPTPEPVSEFINDQPDDTDKAEATEAEIEPMKIELKMPEVQTNLDEAMLFEPMHMVDYFASQGIKLTEEVQTGDKLGKQLKSFTEWLKTMKKVHVENEAGNDLPHDNSIQAMAENSNAEAEVLTEAMAEVFAMQGKPGKATEVYKKLSLLNPAKSTYFAAKIENLKGL